MKLKLDTIIIFVKDVERLKNFYAGILQLEIVEEINNEWLLLRAGEGNVALHKTGNQYQERDHSEIKFESNTKIVFELVEDIRKVRDALLSQNTVIGEIKTFDNYDFWVCDGQDPEGNVFQLKQKKEL